MRNLSLSEQRSVCVSVCAPGHLCVDPVTQLIYHVNTRGIHTLSNIGDGGEGFPGLVWEHHQIATNTIIQADIITASNSFCVIMEEGDVITVNMDSREVETAGSVSGGILGACWSPDQELLALVTGEGNLVIMTADFDPITEFSLKQQDFGKNKFINVGWGKRETQFHGSAGKAAAKAGSGAPVTPITSWDDRKPRISWRGDGQMFVVSHIRPDSESRCLKIVSREGVLQATSEQLQGLEQPLAWRPSGNIIAASQRLTHKLDVIFFEKNGLKHGEFTIPFKSDEVFVKEVMWNQDSSVLLLWLQPLPTNSEGKVAENIVQLWTTSNYHWYLKQELTFKEVKQVAWDDENPSLMYVLTTTQLHNFNWTYSIHTSRGFGILDLAYVAVIDGKKVNMTPFRQSIIPPPMSSYEVHFPESVNCVIFAPPEKIVDPTPDNSFNVEDSGFLEGSEPPGCNSNNVCVFHGADTLTFLTQAHVNDLLDDCGCSVKVAASGGNGFSVNVKVHRVSAQHKIINDVEHTPSISDFSRLYNWTWAAKNKILACYNDDIGSYIVILELQSVGAETGTVRVKSVLPIEDTVVTIATAPDASVVALQLVSGSLLKLNLRSQTVEPYILNEAEVTFPSVCRSVSLCLVDDGNQLLPLGLSRWNRMYLGNDQLFPNCTSFHIHNDHLIVTTTDHKLHILPLMASALTKQAEGKASEEGLVGSRKVERGAKIVTAIAQDTRVVLQMPRGNLEVISPRSLAVHTVRNLLREHQYHEAMDIMRKQRIDLNLLYDHNPSDFLTNIAHFVEDVKNPQWIDLFLANLSEADVTSSMYAFNYNYNRLNADGGGPSSENKIETVCRAVREAMTNVDEEGYLLPILTSFVKMTPSQMNVALNKIKDMKDAEDQNFKVSADEGLRHLLYISDVNELYSVALGTYDFDLVMMIAEKSQKDPKEYLPFLNELRKLSEPYRKYKINVHLRRFREALTCLQGTDQHEEECLALIMKEKLYREALQVFSPASGMTKLVCESYGNYLMTKNYHSEAAIMFSRAGKLEMALHAYQQAGMWRMVLVVGEQLKFDRVMMHNLCLGLVKSLKEKSKFREAAWVYEDYLKNEEEALECLVEASEWEESLRVAHKYQRKDLIETHIKPGSLYHCEFCMGEMERITETITQFASRLAIVREAKQKEHLDFLEGNTEGQLDSDLYSDTSTVTGMSLSRSSRTGSSASGKTYRSTKNKRKLERKKYSTKEGSAFEDVGLVAALHEMYVAADNLATGIFSLCTILVTFGVDQKAIMLQKSFAALLTLMDRKKNDIWPIAASAADEVEFGPQLTTDGALNQLRTEGNGDNSLIAVRMRELEPNLRHPPPPTRPTNWALHMLKDDR